MLINIGETKKSTGPNRGYGYQLRKDGLKNSGNRNFVASWVKRDTPLASGTCT